MKNLKDFILESRYLRGRLKNYNIVGNSAEYIDYFNISNDYDNIMQITDELIDKLAKCDNKCKLALGRTIYDIADLSWFADGLKHLNEIDKNEYPMIEVDTSYKYKNRYYATLHGFGNGKSIHWNSKTQSWEKFTA